MLAWRKWSRGHVPVVGVASGSTGQAHKDEPLARYNIFRLTRDGGEAVIDMHTRGLKEPDGPIIELSRTRIEPHAHAHGHNT
jgi:hypothetical protein